MKATARWGRRGLRRRQSVVGHARAAARGLEPMEPRLLLSVQPVVAGSVYIEEDLGSDLHGDTFILTFEGGAPGTQLLSIEINGDQNSPGFNVGDVFFDTETNPLASGFGRFGADESFPLQIESAEGISQVRWFVNDGTSRLRFEFEGFDPGEVLRFSIDVDEVEDYDPSETDTQTINDGFDPITSGVEFQGSTFVADFSAPNFEPLQITSSFVNRYDPLLEDHDLELPPDDEGGKRDRTAGTVVTGEQIVIPGQLSGYVYHDENMNGVRDAGEKGIGGVVIRAVPLDTVVDQAVQTAETDANGQYLFPELMPGTYQLVEVDQPENFIDWLDQAGTVNGVPSGTAINPGDMIDQIELPGGGIGEDYDFGEILPVEISGQVHLATPDGDCFSEDVEHEPVVGARIELYDAQGNLVATDTTDQNGRYHFRSLMPGTYKVVEYTPEGLFEGGAQAGFVNGVSRGTVVGPNSVTEIVLGSGEVIQRVDFCEVEPVSIRGRVQLSTPDGDCFGEDVEHEPLANVLIRLLNEQGSEVAQTRTDAQGNYSFFDLEPGTYSLVEETPEGYLEGGARVGWIDDLVSSDAFTDGPNRIDQIVLGPGQNGTRFDFCEHAPASLEGYVYHDRDNDGRRDAGEEGIGAVRVQLINESGQVVAERETLSDGRYRFDTLEAGLYRIVESHPANWLDGQDAAGTINGQVVGVAANPGDAISQIQLGWGEAGVDYNFGELLTTSIFGDVHLSTVDGDCFSEDREHEPVAGARVELLDAQGRTLQVTETDANGQYAFRDLAPGEYQVREFTPAGLIDGGARPGTVFGRSVGIVQDAGLVTQITLQSGEQIEDVDFCEHEPSEIRGFVYHDLNNNGQRFLSEPGIGGVTVLLVDTSGTEVMRTTTDASGAYRFEGVHAGTYRIVERQPVGYEDGLDSAGRIDGVPVGTAVNPGDQIIDVSIGWGQLGRDYNFGELLPASIAGFVYVDMDHDCVMDPEDRSLAGVTIELVDADGHVVATQQTDGDGRFRFERLKPGTYTVREIQPDDYFDGGLVVGSGGGDGRIDNQISDIKVASGDNWRDYQFCELPPGMLSGYVFQDGANIVLMPGDALPQNISELRDGQFTSDDRPLAGVVLELGSGVPGDTFLGHQALPGTYPDGVIRTVTNAQGYYEFTGLPPGNFAIYEVQPTGYVDGIDTPGTLPAIAINYPIPPDVEPLIAALRPDHNYDAIIRITLGVGQSSELNNFSEVRAEPFPIPFPVPPTRPAEPFPERVIPPPALLVAPVVEPLSYRPTPYGRFRGVTASTWHLSVVDGGTPRGDGMHLPEGGPYWTDDGEVYEAGWNDPRANQMEWVVPQLDRVNQHRTFGMRQSIALAGDFNGDGFAEVAFYFEGQWFIDINGNWQWDDEDLWAKLGHRDDQPVVGDWDGDGKDDIGVFGLAWPGDPRAVRREPGLPDRQNESSGVVKNAPPRPEEAAQGTRELRLSRNGPTRSDIIDHVFHYGTTGDIAVAGDWNGDGIANIGVFHKGLWHLDRNGDGQFTDDDDVEAEFGQEGDTPIVGDFDGDGVDEIGILRAGQLFLDMNRNYRIDDGDTVVIIDQPAGRPVVADFDGDGKDEVAMAYDNMRFVEIDARR